MIEKKDFVLSRIIDCVNVLGHAPCHTPSLIFSVRLLSIHSFGFNNIGKIKFVNNIVM